MQSSRVQSSPPPHPPATRVSGWIERFAPLVAADARVLDLACGHGRHARYFAGRGHRVVAVDRDESALAMLAGDTRIETRRLDLEGDRWPLPHEHFGAIVVTNYLYRPLFPYLLAALEGDGVLLYETFARGNEVFGRPSNPDFLLQKDELWQIAERRLTVVAFEQGAVCEPQPGAVLQRLAAVGPDRPWPPALPSG
jgi:SAM-dependent methyltransferase